MSKPVKPGVFIPGRLSSERLPKKLILPLNDKGDTLWDIACKKINGLPDKYTKVALCSDKELIDIAEKYQNLKVVVRDLETSRAEGPMWYIFKDLKQIEEVTHWMFLNPCLALLRKETIEKSLDEFSEHPSFFATSVKKYQNWLFTDKAESVTPIDYSRLTTKEITGSFEAAHAFHIFEKEYLFDIDDKNAFMKNKKPGLIVIPKEELVDVDTKQDYLYLKFLLSSM
jgi:CMP-N-acetylneuraminic acid synthetase